MEYRQHGDNAVGVPVGLRGTLKNRVTNVTQRRAVTIADQARTVLERYGDDMPPENRAWLARVARYPDSLSGRVLLAFSPKTRYMSWNMGLKIRLSILLGRR
jgi:rhamnosyltransferase